MSQIFHGCDIGNLCSNYTNYISWAVLLSHEFDQQAQIEQTLGVEVSKGFKYENEMTFVKDQLWFGGEIVQPLWKEISGIFRELKEYS